MLSAWHQGHGPDKPKEPMVQRKLTVNEGTDRVSGGHFLDPKTVPKTPLAGWRRLSSQSQSEEHQLGGSAGPTAPPHHRPHSFHSNSSFLNTVIKQLDRTDKAEGPAPRID
jgi:hypothetical protein